MSANITIYSGVDNTAIINVRDGTGKPVDLRNVTRFVAQHFGKVQSNFTVDTDINAGTITGDENGDITFDYQTLTLLPDDYVVRLTLFDPQHPTDGQDLTHECCGPYLCMKVCS